MEPDMISSFVRRVQLRSACIDLVYPDYSSGDCSARLKAGTVELTFDAL
jgi:hypothetical protein